MPMSAPSFLGRQLFHRQSVCHRFCHHTLIRHLSTLHQSHSHEKPASEQSSEPATSSNQAPEWLQRLRADPDCVDVTRFSSEYNRERRSFVHDSLSGQHKLEHIELFWNRSRQQFHGAFQLGDKLQGHPEFIHGGLSATLLDQIFGSLHRVAIGRPGFTANLNVNFRAPLRPNQLVLVSATVAREEPHKRKVFVEGVVEDGDGHVFADAESLYIGFKS